MVDYLYNPDFWEWKWELLAIRQKTWLLPLFVALVAGRYKLIEHRRIIAFVVFTLLMEHLSTDKDIKNLFSPDTNSPWYHLLTPFLFFFMTNFFTDYFFEGKLKWWLPLVFAFFCLFNATNENWGDGFYNFPSIPVGIYCITGMILALNYFLYMLRTLNSYYLEREPMFWISSGWLIYLSGSFLLWAGIRFIAFDPDFFYSVYRVNAFVAILLNCAFVVALLLNPSTEEKKQTLIPNNEQ